MAQPVKKDLSCYRGQTYSQNIYFKRDEMPIDLSGFTAKAQIRPTENSGILKAEFVCTLYPADGKLNLGLDAKTTSEMNPGSYAWDLKMTKDEEVQYWLKGSFVVTGRVTV